MNRCRLETIRAYWSGRIAAYSAVNADELGTIQAKVWDELIAEQLPWKHPLRILDAGCGPGFFSILMARRGHEITGGDYSEAMIECARENVENHSPEASAYFSQMDAQNLTFEDDTFDVVLSRNLTWNLEHPDRAYAEWLRVLRPGPPEFRCELARSSVRPGACPAVCGRCPNAACYGVCRGG